MRNPGNTGRSRNKDAYSLYHGRSRTPLVTVVRDKQSPLYRILWPDIGLSSPANLTRCMAAAHEWMERSFLTDHRKMSGARRLKSLNNFRWAPSPVEKSGPKHVETTLDHSAAPELSIPMESRRESTPMPSPAARDRLAIPLPYTGGT